tara:strand:+ start:854 stop:1999 length:1146 start_codon:yes stop_codon:yes gene_type:complete
MATHDYVIDNSTGANVRADINNALAAIVSNNSSSSEPSTKYAYMWWADTTNGVLKIRNSANDGWVELLQLDGTLTLEDGSASTPGLAFRDDLNTGIFSSAADTFNVATAGVERMELGATTIFNEDGADVDFRIEGDAKPNLFYVDAGNDRIGIGDRSDPQKLLDVGVNDGSTVEQYLRNNTINLLSKINGTTHAQFGTETSHSLVFLTANGIRATLDTSGNLTIENGDLVIGTAGHGIDFAATSNGTGSSQNELFDDYEEGNWTPANSDMTVTVFFARYTRVGRVVHIVADVAYASSPADTSQVGYLTGLPFTNSGISTHMNLPWFGTSAANDNQFFNTYFTPLIFANDDKFAFLNSSSGTFLARSQLAGKKVRINSMYFV